MTIEEQLAACATYAADLSDVDDDGDNICAACGNRVSVEFPMTWEAGTDICYQCATRYYQQFRVRHPAALRALAAIRKVLNAPRSDELMRGFEIMTLVDGFERGEFN